MTHDRQRADLTTDEHGEKPEGRGMKVIKQLAATETAEANWKSLYKVGGAAALLVVLVALIEIIITFLPGGGRTGPDTVTVIDWFTLLQNHWFLGLRNLGLLNIVMTTLAIPIYFALYGAHWRSNQLYAALALSIALIGVAVFYATNRAFPMLELSHQYAAATTDTQRAMVVAAGQAMLAVGQSHTPGDLPRLLSLGSGRYRDLRGDAAEQGLQQSNRICGTAGIWLFIAL